MEIYSFLFISFDSDSGSFQLLLERMSFPNQTTEHQRLRVRKTSVENKIEMKIVLQMECHGVFVYVYDCKKTILNFIFILCINILLKGDVTYGL